MNGANSIIPTLAGTTVTLSQCQIRALNSPSPQQSFAGGKAGERCCHDQYRDGDQQGEGLCCGCVVADFTAGDEESDDAEIQREDAVPARRELRPSGSDALSISRRTEREEVAESTRRIPTSRRERY